jgi:hypothetical protein
MNSGLHPEEILVFNSCRLLSGPTIIALYRIAVDRRRYLPRQKSESQYPCKLRLKTKPRPS